MNVLEKTEKIKKAISLFVIILIIGVFFYGWIMPEKYNIADGESHLLGLKFMPPCTPFGSDATCGYDMLFLFPITIVLIICVMILISPTSQTSPKGDFSNEKEHNISLKESANTDSQISSNDETSLNNNIKQNKFRRL